MQNKRVVFTAPGIAEIQACDMPTVAPGKVIVRTVVSSVSSGTERANLLGDPNTSISRNPSTRPLFPRYPGYSSSGIVVEVGEGVTSVAPGDRVAVIDTDHCHFVCTAEKNVFKIVIR